MKLLKSIFIDILMAFTVTNAFAWDNCGDAAYRRAHPVQCMGANFTNDSDDLLLWVGGVALIGAGTALATQSLSDSGSSHGGQSYSPRITLSPSIVSNYRPSDLISNRQVDISSYMGSLTNGNDVDSSLINSIKSSATYTSNSVKFDSINMAWAHARGFNGTNVTINILDDFPGPHGNTVYDIVNYVAPDATINTYNIAKKHTNEFTYDTDFNIITTALQNAQPADIYNASWQIHADDNSNAATAIYNNNNTLKTYAQAQNYLYNVTNQNFINQVRNLAADNDAIFVFAAGNDSTTEKIQTESGVLSALPLAFPDLDGHFVNVVAVNNSNQIAWYSNQCGITQNYCIAAPGSSWDGDFEKTGTSFAAPVISGAIATIKEAFPYMNATQITELLFTTATDLGEPGVDTVYGWGLLDMEKATKPVGTPKIILTNNTIQPLRPINVSGPAAAAIKSAGVQMAYFDDFGRAFTTNLSDNINVIPYGRGFDRLREDESNFVTLPNGLEFGFKQNELLKSSGLISAQSNDIVNVIGYKNEFDLSGLKFYQQFRMGISNPTPDTDSIVSGFSTIYTQTIKTGIKWNDLSFEFAVPDKIVAGNMFLDTAIGRATNGNIIYANTPVNLATKSSTEYTIKYNNFSATYINNPDWQDEFFITAKIKGTF